MAMKSPNSEVRPLRSALRYLIKAPAAWSILWPALLIVGGYLAWHSWGADHIANQYYGVDSAKITITQQPEYIRSDLVETVYQDTAMDGLSLLDPQATAKIASAFTMNHWVKRVVSVRKLPGGAIDVTVQYRTPVAMVWVSKPDQSGDFFFPVDGEGILLPTNEFARSETLEYIHITVPGVYATGQQGSPFGDARVEHAAKLAEMLAPHREDIGIIAIGVRGDPRVDQVPQLEVTIEQRESARVSRVTRFWGSPPGLEPPGEATAEMKVQSLLSPNGVEDLRTAGRGISFE